MADYDAEKARAKYVVENGDFKAVHQAFREKFVARRLAYFERTNETYDEVKSGMRGIGGGIKAGGAKLMSRSDGGGGVGSGAGAGNYGVANYPYYSWSYEDYHWFAWKGVPVYKDSDDAETLHFGPDDRGFATVPFFTYNPYDLSTFENPFVEITNKGNQGYGKGVLCNWHSGCEPVSNVLASLFRDGFYYGFPYSAPIGYMFRGNKFPKLVFVYSNEFDNELKRTKTSSCNAVVAIPGIESNKLTFDQVGVKYKDASDNDRESKQPPDPYCMRFIHDVGVGGSVIARDFSNYLNLISVSDYNVHANITAARDDLLRTLGYTRVNKRPKTGTADNGDIKNLDTTKPPKKEVQTYGSTDLQKRGETAVLSLADATWDGMKKILTEEQVDTLISTKKFPGIEYDGKTKALNQDYAQTLGFYELRNVVSSMQDPVNTYVFATNADAPTPVRFEDGACPFLFHDYDFFR